MNMRHSTGSGDLPSANKMKGTSPRTRNAEDVGRIQAHKGNRGSTMVSAPMSVMEYSQPKKKVMLSETDRWLKLSGKMKPFLVGFEQFFASLFSPAITCECETLCYSSVYETVALTIPKEVMALVKSKLKLGDVYPFKLVQQETLGAYPMLERCLCLFRLIAAEKDAMAALVQSKGVVDLGHVIQMQFFYKYFLRFLNHWNYAHPELASADSSLVSLERNFLSTVSERVVCGLLGVVVNEVEFLRVSLVQSDPSGSLAQQMAQDDRVFSPSEPVSDAVEDLKRAPATARVSSLHRSGSFRRKGASPPMTPRSDPIATESKLSKTSSPDISPVASPRPSSLLGRNVSPRSTSVSSLTSLSSSLPSGLVLAPKPQPATMARNNSEKMNVLQSVYASAAFRDSFLEFARTKYAEENVLFLCALVKFKEAAPSERIKLYAAIESEFLTSSSSKEVNLSSKAKKGMLSPPPDFEDLSFMELAWKEVEHQVVQNLCGPFLDLPKSPPSESPGARSPESAGTPRSGSRSPKNLQPSSESFSEEGFVLALDVAMVKDRVKSPGRRTSIVNNFPVSPESGSPRVSVVSPRSSVGSPPRLSNEPPPIPFKSLRTSLSSTMVAPTPVFPSSTNTNTVLSPKESSPPSSIAPFAAELGFSPLFNKQKISVVTQLAAPPPLVPPSFPTGPSTDFDNTEEDYL